MALSNYQVNPITYGFSSTTSKFPVLHPNSNFLSLPKSLRNITYITCLNKIKKPYLLHQTCCKQNTEEIVSKSNINTYRRNLIAGLGGLTVATGLTSITLMATGSPIKEGSSSKTTTTHDHDHHDQLMKVQEFGSQPRKLESPIRVLVSKPKESNNKSKKGKGTYVLIIEGIDIQNDEPVRFDVYVAKPHGGGDKVGPDFGEFAGSLVDLARIRSGRNSGKGSLELGISCLLKDIGGTDSDKLVITLKPRSGDVVIGGVRVDYIYHADH